ncbi:MULTISPECIES: hypothetical protein [unclassified Streptomyces]|uniref:hypothetical protein n=2 Tax=unclassified Streptomyces TaxID=2593676 RepID=UPI0038657803
MIPAMPATAAPSRQASRHASPHASRQASAIALRFGRLAVMGTVAALILIAGVWGSWKTAPYVMLTKGRERGTIEVTRCGEDTCTGPFTPLSQGVPDRGRAVIERTVAVAKGQTYTVVVKPGGDEVLRSGPAGILYAWVPFGGALLLASVVVAGGLGRTRAAWVMAGSGVALLTAAFVTI